MNDTPELPIRRTQHPQQVKEKMHSLNINEQAARDSVARDLTISRLRRDQANSRAELRSLTRHSLLDPLTNLYNRRALEGDKGSNPPIIGELQKAWEHSIRSGEPWAVIMIDIDHFKTFNDEFGHPAGDVVFKEIARRISDNIRPDDMPFRIGGEELLVILRDILPHEAREVAERLRAAVEQYKNPHRQITISCGLTDFHPALDGDTIYDPKQLVEEVDKLLYTAKHAGRNKIAYKHREQKSRRGGATNTPIQDRIRERQQSGLAPGVPNPHHLPISPPTDKPDSSPVGVLKRRMQDTQAGKGKTLKF